MQGYLFNFALAFAIACIAVDVDGAREVIRNGKTGLLVPPQNPKALTGAIRTLLVNPAFGRRMGTAGQRLVLEMYDQRRMVQEITAVYGAMLAERQP